MLDELCNKTSLSIKFCLCKFCFKDITSFMKVYCNMLLMYFLVTGTAQIQVVCCTHGYYVVILGTIDSGIDGRKANSLVGAV